MFQEVRRNDRTIPRVPSSLDYGRYFLLEIVFEWHRRSVVRAEVFNDGPDAIACGPDCRGKILGVVVVRKSGDPGKI